MRRNVEKIDINREFIAVNSESNFLEFFKESQVPFRSPTSDSFVINTEKYRFYEYIDPMNKSKRCIALKDQDIFDKILSISQDKYQIDLKKAEYDGYLDGCLKGHSDTMKYIKSLNWFELLYNKFFKWR